MSTRRQWQLMTIEEIAMVIKETHYTDSAYRKQKSYYRKAGNTVMLSRFEQAELLLESNKYHVA